MGKGGRGNCERNQVGMDAGAASGAALAAPVQAPATNLYRQPSPTLVDLERIQALLVDPDIRDQRDEVFDSGHWGELDSPEEMQARMSQEPAFSVEEWTRRIDGYVCPRSGFRLVVPERTAYDSSEPGIGWRHGRFGIFCAVYEGDRPIGDVVCGLYGDRQGKIEFRIGAMDLTRWLHGKGSEDRNADESRMGRGFGRGVVGLLEHNARELGVERMSLHAVPSAAYTWSSMGFGFDPRPEEHKEADAKAMLEQMAVDHANGMLVGLRHQAQMGHIDPQLPPRLAESMQKHIDEHGIPLTPYELSQLGQDVPVLCPRTGKPSWAGKLGATQVEFNGLKLL